MRTRLGLGVAVGVLIALALPVVAGPGYTPPPGTGTGGAPGPDSITTTEIADATIAAADLATGAVTSAKILDGTIATADIAAGAVTTTEIAADTIAAADIAPDAVGSSEIAADAVGSSEIATDAVGAAEIAADAITASEIATDAVDSAEIKAGAVGTSEIADGTIANADISSSAAIAPSKFAVTGSDNDSLCVVSGVMTEVTPSTAAHAMTLGSSDTATLGALNVSDADTTLGRRAAGRATIEGNELWRDGDTQALTDAATISWDLSLGRFGSVTLAGNRTLANATNPQTGEIVGVTVTEDATGQRTLAFGTNYEPCQIRRAAASTTFCEWFYNGTSYVNIAEAHSYIIPIYQGTATTWTSQPAATTELFGATTSRRYYDTTGLQEGQITASVTTAGTAGATIGPQCSPDNGSTWYAWDDTSAGDLGSIDPQVANDAIALVKSGWYAIPSHCRGTGMEFRVVGDDGTANTAFNQIWIVLR